MKHTCTIYVIRHGESVANREDTTGGDSMLTEKGRQQARLTKDSLKDIHFDDAFSSDLVRAVDTAGLIYGHDISKDHQLAAFREREFGSLEGRPNSEWMAIKDAWEEKYSHLPFHERHGYEYAEDIESDKALIDRFMNGLGEVAKTSQGKTVLVVTSAGPIRVMLMDLGFADFLTVGSFDNAGYVELRQVPDGFRIVRTFGVHKPEATDYANGSHQHS